MYITENNIKDLKVNGRIVSKRLSIYKINPDYNWCKTKSENIYCIEHSIYKQPTCKGCGKSTKFLSPKQGGGIKSFVQINVQIMTRI